MHDDPIAYFITWTVYGTFLQGDARGWRRWKGGLRSPQPRLAQWRANRLTHPVLLLSQPQREALHAEIERLSEFRGWRVLARAAQTNHVHVVVHAQGYSGAKVRDQLKANCTRVLRAEWPVFLDRPVWTRGGDWKCINDKDDLEQVIRYVAEAQSAAGR